MNISDNIKYLRKSFNLSQKDLGLIADVSDKAVWSWEQGTREPRMGALQRLADHFGLKKSDIIDGDLEEVFKSKGSVSNKVIKSGNLELLTDAELTLIKKYRQLDADGKEDINDLIDSKLARAERAAKEQEEGLG